MKKTIIYILLAINLWIGCGQMVFAQTTYTPEELDQKVNQLFNPGKDSVKSSDSKIQENIEAVNKLTNKDEKSVISKIIQDILLIGASLATIAIIVASIFYIISMGNDDQMNKAKNIILYTIIGLVIISIAYGIVIGVAKLQFFD